MIITARRLSELDFPKLMEVYEEENRREGGRLLPGKDWQTQKEQIHEEARLYLRDVFFRQKEAAVYVLAEDGIYLSALRLEAYRDGVLLQSLETRPDRRRQGHADRLIRQVLAMLPGGTRVYSHVDRRNGASEGVHLGCGFERQLEFAVLLDGTVTTQYRTFYLETKKERP